MRPEVCKECGNVRVVGTDTSLGCPFCRKTTRLSLASDDSTYLIFLALIERLKQHLGEGEIYEFEPTAREFESLQHGDQIVDYPVVWRILGKRTHSMSGARSMVMALTEAAKVSRSEEGDFVSALPPFVGPTVLQSLSLDQMVDHSYIPVALDELTETLLMVGFGDERDRDELRRDIFPRQVVFWRTTTSAFQRAFRAYYADYQPRGCYFNYGSPCSRRWNGLEGTDSIDVRFCGDCRRRVFLLAERDPTIEVHVRLWNTIAKFSDQGVTRPRFSFNPGEPSHPRQFVDPFELT